MLRRLFGSEFQTTGAAIKGAFTGRLKGIFSDSNNIFSLHKSEDINKKMLFPKFQLVPI